MQNAESNWRSLYRVGAWVALVFILYSLLTMVVIVAIGAQPGSVQEVFDLLEENRLVGLLRLDALTLMIVPLYYPLFLSLSVALRRTNPSYVALGALLAFTGVTLFLATPSVLSWVALGEKFAAATSAAHRAQLLAAGEVLFASDMWHGSGAVTGGLLMLASALILSIVMLKNTAFSRWTAYVGILTHGLDLVHGLVGFFSPQVGVIFMAIAGPLYLVWFPLLARDFFRLSRNEVSSEEKNEVQ